jgi:hypothetical protein
MQARGKSVVVKKEKGSRTEAPTTAEGVEELVS